MKNRLCHLNSESMTQSVLSVAITDEVALNGFMSGKYTPLTTEQLEVLQWVGDGCPADRWDGHAHKLVARGLANISLIRVHRVGNRWTAEIREAGQYYLKHHRYDPQQLPKLRKEPEFQGLKLSSPKKSRKTSEASIHVEEQIPSIPDELILPAEPLPPLTVPADATVRTMRRIANRSKKPPKYVAYPPEVPMKFTVMVTRVQVAERSVHATDEESAARKVQEEFDRPYGYFGSWKTVSSEVEVTERESVLSNAPSSLSSSGSLLLTLKDAGTALGISYSTINEVVNRGDLEHVVVGSRKYVAREALLQFIEDNTHRGYH